MYIKKLICNKRLSAESTQTNASDNDYVTKSEMDTAISAIPDPPDLTGLIEKEEDATSSSGNSFVKLDIVRIGDDNTGEIRFGKDNPSSGSEYAEPKSDNSVITKRYFERFVNLTESSTVLSVCGNIEAYDIRLGSMIRIYMDVFNDSKIMFYRRIKANAAQTNAAANDYVTKSEVDALIAAAIANL
jgi:hypothetical protein